MKHERITDLSYKEVIHLESGQRLGYVRDAEIDPATGKVTALSVALTAVALTAALHISQKNKTHSKPA